MKTTKQRLVNIVATMSATVNLVMLGGLGYIAAIDNDIKKIHTAINSPVVIYVPKSMESSDVMNSVKQPAMQ